MAVKRKTLAEKRKDINEVMKAINKKAGKTVIGNLDDEEIAEKLVIDWIATPSLKLNQATGGGFPRSKFSIVTGNSNTGKTMLLLETMAKNLKEDPDFTCLWIESENSLEETSIKMFGITDKDLKERFTFMNTEDMSAEEVLEYVILMAHTGIDMIVVNSLKCLTPDKEMKNEMKDDTIALQARVNSKFMRKVIPVIATTGTALICIQHLSTNIGSYMGGQTMAGGNQIKYNNVLTLELSKGFIDSKDTLGPIRDQYMPVKVKVTKNHCVTDKNVYVETSYFVKYGEGIDSNPEVIDAVISSGIVEKAGAWIREYNTTGPKEKGNEKILPDGSVAKWNGMKAFMTYVNEHPEYFEYLKNRVEGKLEVDDLSEDEIEELEQQNKNEVLELNELNEMIDDTMN